MTGPALVRLSVAVKELGAPSLRTAYNLVKENGELLPGLPAFRVRSNWYVTRPQLDRIKAEGVRRSVVAS